MRFHSKKCSQSAVSVPTRLSVPFDGMSSALNQKSAGIVLLVVRQVLVECRARGHAGLLQLDDDQRQAVDEADQIRAAGVERAGDAELADEQEIVVRRILPIDHAQALGLLAAVFAVRHGDLDAFLEQPIDLAVRRLEAHRRTVAGQLIDGGGDRLGRQRRIQPFQRRAQAGNQHHLALRLAPQSCRSRRRFPPAPTPFASQASANNPMAGCSTSWSSV